MAKLSVSTLPLPEMEAEGPFSLTEGSTMLDIVRAELVSILAPVMITGFSARFSTLQAPRSSTGL